MVFKQSLAPLPLFAADKEWVAGADRLAALNAGRSTAATAARHQAQVHHAWSLRQRDTRQALHLCDESEAWLRPHAGERALDLLLARCTLIRAEARWLMADLVEARRRALDAQQGFRAHDDALGLTDCHWLLALIAADEGDLSARETELLAAREQARRSEDSLRMGVLDAAHARFSVLRDPTGTQARFGHRWDATAPPPHPALNTWVQDFHGLLAGQAGDLPRSTACLERAHEAALASGQLQRAILIATNIGNGLNTLGDHESGLRWMQRGLDLARGTGWPASLGLCLMQAGETLRLLGRPAAAKQWLEESLDILSPLAQSRLTLMASMYLAELSMDKGHTAEAAACFTRVQQRADAMHMIDFQISSRGGRARSLAHFGQPELALAVAQEALTLARQHGDKARHIDLLTIIGGLHQAHPLPFAEASTAPNAALHYWAQALNLAQEGKALTPPVGLLQSAAAEHARCGQTEQAYALALQALEATRKQHSRDAVNSATAMEIRHQSERHQAELQRQRDRVMAEAQRAADLQQLNHTLERLSAVGQEITAHLDAATVVQTLARHVHRLLDAQAFAIYLHAPEEGHLNAAFGLGPCRQGRIALSDAAHPLARCARTRQEVITQDPATNGAQGQVLRTQLCLPIAVGERLLGVMLLQSQAGATQLERERLVGRSLCAYAAIALDNAQAYAQLKQTRDQLVHKEKLAALGALVAGVAHELNTPIGNGVLMASTLRDRTRHINSRIQTDQLKRSELQRYVEDNGEGLQLILSGLNDAADLVNSFKRVAVDQTSEKRRRFTLQQACQDVLAAMGSKIRAAGHQVVLDIAPDLTLDSFPGPLSQVLSNLVDNSLIHAYGEGEQGTLRLSARPLGTDAVRLQFADHGRGIAAQHLPRVFEPFFTTRLGQGGSGLGLSISYNLVHSVLQGQISVSSEAGQGTVFTLDLPLNAGVSPG